jgi:hypothetical protein
LNQWEENGVIIRGTLGVIFEIENLSRLFPNENKSLVYYKYFKIRKYFSSHPYSIVSKCFVLQT